MTKIDIISGFLGAGKTTFIKRLLKEAISGEKVVLIENEFGEIGIDGGFLKDAGIEIREMTGNEDVGQMSAWYVLSSLGMYEAEPAGGRYWFGSPLFDRVEITVPGGTFTIVAENNSAANKYIQRVWLNGQPYTKPWIGHADLMKGGELRFEMGAEEKVWYCPDEPEAYADQRPAEEQRSGQNGDERRYLVRGAQYARLHRLRRPRIQARSPLC